MGETWGRGRAGSDGFMRLDRVSQGLPVEIAQVDQLSYPLPPKLDLRLMAQQYHKLKNSISAKFCSLAPCCMVD